MDLQLREAKSSDTAFLVHLAWEAYRELVTRQFGGWDDADQGARFESKLSAFPFLVVELDGEPVAAVSSSELPDHIFLNELLVVPAMQNRGIGSFLLTRELRRASVARKPLRLHTLHMNRAIRFYERDGLVVTSRGDVFVDMERVVA